MDPLDDKALAIEPIDARVGQLPGEEYILGFRAKTGTSETEVEYVMSLCDGISLAFVLLDLAARSDGFCRDCFEGGMQRASEGLLHVLEGKPLQNHDNQ